jgi:6-phosphogluconolactonase
MTVITLKEATINRLAAEIFVESSARAITARGRFMVALSGGNTPKSAYTILADQFSSSVRWDLAHIFFSDERCVPPDHPDSNFGMAYRTLLSKIPISHANIHRMKGEKEPMAAADDYALELKDIFRLSPGKTPQFDLIYLGMGEDGHIASIFPGSELITFSRGPVAAPYIPKLEEYRLTLTPPVINHARHLVFLVIGSSKAEALREVLEGDYDSEHCPAQLVRNAEGEVTWLVDLAAASLLTHTPIRKVR